MIKNIVPFRMNSKWMYDAESLHAQLARHPARSCGEYDMRCSGWVPPREGVGLVMVVDGQYLLLLRTEEKVLPTGVIKKELKKRVADLAAKLGHPVGRKARKQLEEQITDEFLPRAFTKDRFTPVWIYPKGRWIGVGTSNASKAEDALAVLIRSLDSPPEILHLNTADSPQFVLRNWLANEAPAYGFTIDDQCELADKEKATVKYAHHSLGGVDMQHHLATGKLPRRLGLTYDESISFVVTHKLALTKIKLTDVTEADVRNSGDNYDEASFAMIASDVARALDALVDACGGLVLEEKPADSNETTPRKAGELVTT